MTLLRQIHIFDSNGDPLEAVDNATPVLKVALHDALGNPINSLDSAIDVHLADVHDRGFNRRFRRLPGTSTTFAANAAAGATAITVASAAGFAIGNHLEISSATAEEIVLPVITNIAGAVITLNQPLDNAYLIGDSVALATVDMSVLGTLGAPVSYVVAPNAGDIWHLVRINIEMTHTSAGDNGLFGNLAALTNGVILRVFNGGTGLYSTVTNWRSNSDMVTDFYNVTYAARSGGGGAFGTNGQFSILNSGSIIVLDGDNGDFMEVLIQDDLTGLSTYVIKAQGHFEG